MEKIKVLIVEDDAFTSEGISVILSDHGLATASICSSGEEALAYVEAGKSVDLIMMDIALSGALDGISTAQQIMRRIDVPLIYLTDYTDAKTFARAKKTFPVSYLSKPFVAPDLMRAVELALVNASRKSVLPRREQKHILLRTDAQRYIKLPPGEILYLQAERAYCRVVTAGGTHTLSTSMNNVASQLDSEDFVRVHRSYIVNLSRVTAVAGNTITLENTSVALGREYRENFLTRVRIIK